MRTLLDLAAALAGGSTTSRALVEGCLDAIADPAGEGARTFLKVTADAARARADTIDAQRRAGRAPGPFAGIPSSLKDLFDVAGEVTTAGSVVLDGQPPAERDAPVVQRYAAGFVSMGRSNMTEFAFSGLGINPHYGTPASPWDRATRRIPGGSSSGAAVSISDGMAFAALGTDTGGSCRMPAALCGVVGYKPTARRVPNAGVLPLSTTLDSLVGPLANSVACCAIIDAVLSGAPPAPPTSRALAGVTLALPDRIVTDALDAATAAAFERALARLTAAGVRIQPMSFPALSKIGAATAGTSLAACEAYAWHRGHIARGGARYDRRVRARIEAGGGASAAEYIDALAARQAIIAQMDQATARFDALIMPTVPIVAPPIAELEADDGAYNRANALILRNPSLFNFLDRCAISLPCHQAGDPAAGLMLVGETMGDTALFSLAAAVEAALSTSH